MKRVILSLLTAVALVFSCSKDDPAPAAPTLPSSPEAKAEHDNKSGGIYKGTFANSANSGSIKIVLQEGKTEVVLIYNGTTKTLTTDDLSAWTSGDAITSAVFSNGTWIVIFEADGDAASFGYQVSIDGSIDFDGLIVKEVSTALVRVYEGTYAGDATGKWNFCTQGNLLAGVYTGSGTGSFEGTITGTTISITEPGGDVTATGTLTGEGAACSGTWASSSSDGTWTGTRKI